MIKNALKTILVGGFLISCSISFADEQQALAQENQVCFSPASQNECSCKQMVIESIREAEYNIAISIYSLTDVEICNTITDAHNRGVQVSVSYNIPKGKYTCIDNVQAENKIAIKSKTEHNKYMVIDGRYIVTGSYNFTKNGNTSNYENCVKIDNDEIARRYLKDFNKKIASKYYLNYNK